MWGAPGRWWIAISPRDTVAPDAVRPCSARPGDLAGLARVRVDAWRSTYRGIGSDECLDGLRVESDFARGFDQWLKGPMVGWAHFVAVLQRF